MNAGYRAVFLISTVLRMLQYKVIRLPSRELRVLLISRAQDPAEGHEVLSGLTSASQELANRQPVPVQL